MFTNKTVNTEEDCFYLVEFQIDTEKTNPT